MGCRAITPKLVGLASELQGKPFHLIVTDRQRGKKADQVRYLKSLGLSGDNPNFTASSAGSHPKVKGNGYVPYYMVFDRHGKLVRHHMCGAYHGGDGLGMIDWVKRLLKETPPIYLGREPFTAVPDLADRIAWRKKFPGPVKDLEGRIAAGEDGSEGAVSQELERLHAAVSSWVDGRLLQVDRLYATRPSGVIPALTGLSKELKRTELGVKVEARLKEMKASRELKDSIAIEKTFTKTRDQYERADDRQWRAAASAARKKLEQAIDGKDDLPIARAVKAWLAELPS